MSWRAVIPLKGRGERKTRLAGRLTEGQRRSLSHHMFDHVSRILQANPDISETILLSDMKMAGWSGGFLHDEGRGLNAELAAFAAASVAQPLLVIHADLPLLVPDDVAALLSAASSGCAIAPDRFESGTNALALADPPGFGFAFGPESFAYHLGRAGKGAAVVKRAGLALDVDTPDDLDAAIGRGYLPPV